ncbi:MAG: S-adenosylmethionine-dependent methyltransferase [Deferribacteraceae bacterium]|jgi:ubiquinone/menaquinone biosynthesis C-methylase UbiE|nr:S-adenosylmethionine-dependent methyltransferase [Deferribacteraceae bacterium]
MLIGGIMSSFDYKAFYYDQNPMHIERAQKVADSIKLSCNIDKNHVIADFGCGTGLLGLQFAPLVRQVDMIDNSPKMLQVLDDKIKKLDLKNVNTVFLDLDSCSNLPLSKYDIIMTLMTFHHIKDIKKAIFQLSQMLKKDGKLVICDLDEEDGSYHSDGNTIHNGINQEILKNYAIYSKLNFITSKIPYIIKKEIDGNNKSYPVFMHIYGK